MKQTDFTTGNVLRQMITFSLPIMLTNLLQTSYQFIDTLWVGNLIGANALGAVAISSTVLFSVLALILGVNSATLRSEEHTSELQSRGHLVCRLLLEKKK